MSEAENKQTRYYIQCPKEEKEEAKALGARWDPKEVKWYYTNPEDRDKFQKWLQDGLSEDTESVSKKATKNVQERYYIECPFDDNEQVKKLGGRWDPKVKKWYYTNPEDKEKFKKWLPEGIVTNEKNKPEITKKNTEKRYYILCSKDEKEEVKKLGARWDKDAVKWYYTNPEDKDKFQRWQMDNFKVYEIPRKCYKCDKKTTMLSYIKFDDDKMDDVVFPWNKERLLDGQDTIAHMMDPKIEYYGLKVLGADEQLDDIMLKKYPECIKVCYSRTQERRYPMNICKHCGAPLGWYELYCIVNDSIKKDIELKVFEG